MFNKRGGIFFAIVIALMLFMVGVISVDFVKDSIIDARTSNTCTFPTSDGNKLLCLLFDSVVPYFIIIFISVAGGYIINEVAI